MTKAEALLYAALLAVLALLYYAAAEPRPQAPRPHAGQAR